MSSVWKTPRTPPPKKARVQKSAGQEWLQLLPVVGTLSLLAYVTYNAFKAKPEPKNTKVNLKIQKESSKVVNMVDIEELGDKVSYCRCWRSKKLFKDIYVRGHQGPASSDTRLNTGFLYVMAAITNIMKNVVIMLGPLF